MDASSDEVFIPEFRSVPVPKEGENGVFTQSWYAICLASEVGAGEIKEFPFLDGNVVVYRTKAGDAHVLSAYCPHMGANLARGFVSGDRIVCGFHRWEFERAGRCVKTGNGDPVPPRAGVFHFPTVERWGLIFAFNGTHALWDLPDFIYPDDQLLCTTLDVGSFMADPIVVCCNTPDYHHFRLLHGIDWDHPDPDPVTDFRWTDHSFEYELEGVHWNEMPMRFTFGIYGATFYFQQGWLDGQWYGWLAPLGLRRPGETRTYFVTLTHLGDGSPEAVAKARAFNEFASQREVEFVDQDVPILNGVRFVQGALTGKDRPLAMFLDMFRKMPRAHPSRPFIT